MEMKMEMVKKGRMRIKNKVVLPIGITTKTYENGKKKTNKNKII